MFNLLSYFLACLMVVSISVFSYSQEKSEDPSPEQTIKSEPSVETADVQQPEPVRPTLAKEIFSLSPLKKKGPDEKKWFYNLSGGMQMKMGNTETFNVNGETSLAYNTGITELSLSYEIFYGEADNRLNEHNSLGTIMLDHYVHPRIELFLFSSGEYDKISELIFRNNSGIGAKFVFFRNRYWVPDLSLAPIYQYEKYSGEDEKHEARASLRARVKITPVPVLKLQFTCFYIPAFDDINNYRFNIDTYIETRIIAFSSLAEGLGPVFSQSGLYFICGYKRNYNSKVPLDLKKTDHNIYIRIALKV